jgi:putative sigma-54 modulation protein
MQIELRWKGTDRSEALEEYARIRSDFALARLSRHLRHVVVRFEDENGPKHGIDKRCTVELHGDFGVKVTSARAADFHAATDLAFDKASQALVRAVGHREAAMRPAPTPPR